MKVSEWIAGHETLSVTVPAETHLDDVADTFVAHLSLRDLYVTAIDGSIIGVIRYRRLVQILLAEHLRIQSAHQLMERLCCGPASEIMESDFVVAHLDEELDNVLSRMLEYEVEDLPVTDGSDKIVGSINLTAVLRAVREDGL